MSLKLGDLVEIPTAKGLAYAIYTHRHTEPPKFGALIQVFDGLYETRPADLHGLLSQPIRFATFFPLQAAVNQHIVSIAGHVEVPERLKPFPTFRSGTVDPKTGKVPVWWLWDGQKTWRAGDLTPEQRKLPIRGVWNDTFLKERIEEGWRPELDKR